MTKIAVASGKGGTGKTTLSTNLAEYMAGEGYSENIILADMDVEEPDSGLFIRSDKREEIFEKTRMVPEWLREKCTGCGKCDELCNFNAVMRFGNEVLIMPELCHSCYACSELCPEEALPMKPRRMGMLTVLKKNEYTFIEGRLDIGQEQAVPMIAASIEQIKEISSEESVIIFDSPPGSSCPVMEVAKNSDYVILVTEPTPFGFHDLKLAADTMRQLNKEFGIVINKYGLGNNDVEEYCKEKGIEIIARIPNMRKIAELYSAGSIIYKSVPEFRSELKKAADFILRIKRRIK